jgi:cytochrome P450
MLTQTAKKLRKPKAISDALRFSKNQLKFFNEIIAETNDAPLIPFKVGTLESVLVNNTDLIRQLLNSYETFEKKSITYNEIRKMFDNGIIFSNSDEWRHNRKAINPAFHKRALEGYLKIFSERGMELAAAWRKQGGEPINLYRSFTNVTIEITLDAFFNHNLDDDEKRKIVSGIDDLLKYTQKRLLRGGLKLPDFIPVPENLAIARAKKGYHEVMNKIFHEKTVSAVPSEKITIIDLLLNADSFFGGPMTKEQIIAEASSIMLAATETTASLLTWMFFELTKHPVIKEKIKHEIESVFGRHDEITIDKLKLLKYCRQTIHETLRVYPPAWLLSRSISEDAVLGDTEFKKGTTFYFAPYIIHRNKSVWSKPEEFNPDRFAPENLTEAHKDHFMPFISGPRKCIGEEFSIWEALIIMIKIIPDFDWNYPIQRDPIIEFNATIRPLNEKGEYEVLMTITPTLK